IKMPSVGWRTTFFILAIVTSAVFVAAAFIVKNPPAGIKLPAPKGAAKKDAGDLAPRDYTPVEMLKRPSFWKLFIFFILLAAVGSAAISFAKDILKDAGSSDDLAVTLVGLIAIGNAVGRLASGWFFDAIGRRKTQYVMSSVAIAAPLVVVVALVTHSLAIAVIGLFICYISFGFAPTGSTAFISAFYGQKHFPLNLSILNLQLVLTSFAAPLAGVIKDSTGSFVTTFVILIGFSLVGLVLNLTMRKP
ncbi:MAG: OFA family MFS transporter, partial [Clostridiales bacterium]|nr:OFA family MFS transporter [Clostridiales bacterium]